METTRFQVDICVLVVATYAKRFVLHFGKELPTEREFGNFVDYYAVAVKKDSSDYVPSGFKYSFRSDHAHFIAKYSKYKHCTKNLARNANLTRRIKSRDKIATDFNVNSMRCKNKVLTLKICYIVP